MRIESGYLRTQNYGKHWQRLRDYHSPERTGSLSLTGHQSKWPRMPVQDFSLTGCYRKRVFSAGQDKAYRISTEVTSPRVTQRRALAPSWLHHFDLMHQLPNPSSSILSEAIFEIDSSVVSSVPLPRHPAGLKRPA